MPLIRIRPDCSCKWEQSIKLALNAMPSAAELVCKGKSVIYNDVTWVNQYDNRSGLYAFALTGRGFPRCTRLPRVSLRLPWAKRSLGFQPVALDGPIVPDFFTSNWTPYQLCSNLSRSDEPRGEPSLLGLSRGENASRREPMNACKIKLHRKQEFWFLECGAKLRSDGSMSKKIQQIQPKIQLLFNFVLLSLT